MYSPEVLSKTGSTVSELNEYSEVKDKVTEGEKEESLNVHELGFKIHDQLLEIFLPHEKADALDPKNPKGGVGSTVDAPLSFSDVILLILSSTLPTTLRSKLNLKSSV